MTSAPLRIQPPGREPFDRDPALGPFVVGRSAQADVSVDDQRMSRKHARFVHRDEAWWVEDLDSSNGTSVNGRPCVGATRLAPGDVVMIGQTRVTVADDGYAAAADAARATPSALRTGTISTAGPGASSVSRADPLAETAVEGADAGRLRILNEVHRALATPITLPDLLDLILERVFAVLQPEEGAIFLQQRDSSLKQAATRRLPGATGELLVSRSLVEEVIGKRTPAVVVDALMDERFAVAQSVLLSGVRSIAAAPIVDAEGCLGMIALYSRVRVRRFTDADLQLLVSLASTAALRVRNVALMEEAAERRVLERELTLAHDIQMGMLPRRFPDCEGVEIAAVLKPARSVGGDFYDVVLDEGRLWFIVGDVSGKGVAAALFMAVAKTLFRAMRHGGESVAQTMASMNRELARDNDRAMFVTAFAGWLEPASGRARFCNAGHNPPFRLDLPGRAAATTRGANAGAVVARVLADSGGPALGVFEDASYQEHAIELAPGDAIVIYTDGATDARSPAGQQFGLDRVRDTLERTAREGGDASRLVDRLFRALQAFETDASQEDDITLLALRYTGRATSA